MRLLAILLLCACSSPPQVDPEPVTPADHWPAYGELSWPGALDLSALSHYEARMFAQEDGDLPPDSYKLLGAADGVGAWQHWWSPADGGAVLTFDACEPDGWPSPDGATHFALWQIAPGESLLVQIRDSDGALVRRWLPHSDWWKIPAVIVGGAQ